MQLITSRSGKKTFAHSWKRREDDIRLQLTNFAQNLPSSLQEALNDSITKRILREQGILTEKYYRCLSPLFMNERTKVLRLTSARFFQDSSLALETFLADLSACTMLKEFAMSKQVTDLICFELEPVLDAISRKSNLESVTIQGLAYAEIEIERDEIELFLTELSENCPFVRTLDLSNSAVDARCCQLISELPKLKVLKLVSCPSVDTASVVFLLNKCKQNLIQFDCGNRIQSALSSMDNFAKLKLQCLTFKQPSGFSEAARVCPDVEQVKISHNDNEGTGDFDRNLADLLLFQKRPQVQIDFDSINMLFLIQLEHLSSYGSLVTKLVFTQCDFLHPQSLNPFAFSCPNVDSLSFFGCETVGDDLFDGDLPAEAETPFPKLKELTFEGSFANTGVIRFLTHAHAKNLTVAKLHTTGHMPSTVTERLRSLSGLRKLHLSVGGVSSNFMRSLTKLVRDSETLDKLEILSYSDGIERELKRLGEKIRERNLNVSYLYHVRKRTFR